MTIKALGLLSGGLDSTLAIKLILNQGIEVMALNFTSPFCLCNRKGRCEAVEVAEKFQIPIKVIPKSEDYLDIVKYPKFGRGKNMNPCIDCRIFMFKKAKIFAKEIGANFIFTGEVLNQRPMSQHRKALKLVEIESGLEGKILRPLSAKLLPKTEAEIEGWVDKAKMLGINGRSRKIQMQLANNINLVDYHCPAGGCLLTYSDFSAKIKDLINNKPEFNMKDVQLLKIGRHFRYNKNKIIVGRNKSENMILKRLKYKNDYLFEVTDTPSPIALLQGPKTTNAINLTARITLRYSDSKVESFVRYGPNLTEFNTIITPLENREIDKLRILKG